jgi:hypothetical protein
LEARLTTLLCKQINVAASKNVKTGCNLAESSKKGCGAKKGCLPNDNDDDDDDDVWLCRTCSIPEAYLIALVQDDGSADPRNSS